nr:hypothetical protein [Tanacetum cinerariifolium]
MHGVNNPELTKRLNEHVPKTMEEMMSATTAFIRGETVVASKKKVQTLWKSHDQSKRQTFERRSDFRNQPKDGRGPNKFTPLTRTPKEIFTAESRKFKPPSPMVTPVKKRSSNKFCEFHNDKGHSTDECVPLRKQIEELPSDMTGVPRSIVEHRLDIREGYSPVRQKKGAGPRARQGNPSKGAKTGRGRNSTRSIRPRLVIQPGHGEEARRSWRIKRNVSRIHDKFRRDKTMPRQDRGCVTAPIPTNNQRGEHNITYWPQTSVKGQILADFLVEKPNDAPPEASVIKTPQESWILFMDGSSCVDGSEYQALIASLRIAAQMGVRNIHVLVEVRKEKSIQEREMGTIVEEEGPTWMTSIIEYLRDETLPDNQNEASKLPPLPFYKWGIHIAGPFSEGLGKVKFLIVAMDYFTKWIEAKAVVTISSSQVKKFVWDNIVCHFGLPGEIVTNNVKHLQSNGLIERPNKSLGEGIKARLAVILIKIRMTTYRTTVVDAMHNDEGLQLNLDLLEERRERAAIREAKGKLKITKYYNARVRGVTFRPKDFLYRSNNASHAVDGGKLGPKWEGPYGVMEALGDRAYKLRSTNGTVLPRTWNIANLKKVLPLSHGSCMDEFALQLGLVIK